jgi:hypothetical protein
LSGRGFEGCNKRSPTTAPTHDDDPEAPPRKKPSVQPLPSQPRKKAAPSVRPIAPRPSIITQGTHASHGLGSAPTGKTPTTARRTSKPFTPLLPKPPTAEVIEKTNQSIVRGPAIAEKNDSAINGGLPLPPSDPPAASKVPLSVNGISESIIVLKKPGNTSTPKSQRLIKLRSPNLREVLKTVKLKDESSKESTPHPTAPLQPDQPLNTQLKSPSLPEAQLQSHQPDQGALVLATPLPENTAGVSRTLLQRLKHV